MPSAPTDRKRAVIPVAILLWIPLVWVGMSKLLSYSTTPGLPAEPPNQWPRSTAIERAAGKFTLILFAHPQCECTEASLGELGMILAHSAGRASTHVFVLRPDQEPAEWTHSDLWNKAAAIPGVRVEEDRNGALARSFGVHTSGQTLLYDPAGNLIFKGGITSARGHSGDNAGRSLITEILQGSIHPEKLPVTTPVFGCSLRGE